MDISPAALVNAATQMQQSQVAQTAQALVLKKAMGNTGHRRAGAATGPAVGHEWQFGHAGQRDGVVR
jgi:hypothetical protein